MVTGAIAIAALAMLAGCGGGSDGPTGGLFSSSLFGSSSKMAVAPIIGVPQKQAQELTQALVVAGKERNLTLIPGKSAGGNTLRGYLVATAERRGAKISYIWDVIDSKGKRVVRVSGEETIAKRSGRDPWSGVDSAALRSLANKSTSQLAASLGRGSSTPAATAKKPGIAPPGATTAAASQKPKGPVMALVAPVSGAPGDGRVSLTAALKKKLYAGGVKLAGGAAASSNVYTIKGKVSVTNASGGKQSVRIDWQVIDPKGKEVGSVTQKNNIPKGSLNGPWGAIADAAAGAAADGIIKLLPRSRG
jgi:hypothetical protein